jgi:hypothetical protein
LTQLPQDFLVFPRQEDLLGAQAVPEGVQADGGLALWRPGAGALEGVLAVSSGLLVARHDIDPSVIFVSIRTKEL